MSFTMAPLLIHNDEVPPGAREALRAAYGAPPERRSELLESAARILFEETDLECRDIHELVGVFSDEGCS